jgi:hypothetical protein
VNFTLTADYLPGRHAMILGDITERVEAQHSALEIVRLAWIIANWCRQSEHDLTS